LEDTQQTEEPIDVDKTNTNREVAGNFQPRRPTASSRVRNEFTFHSFNEISFPKERFATSRRHSFELFL
jgi:hypothetical protein